MLRYVAVVLLAWGAAAASAEERPKVSGQATFLYYTDLARAERFYSEVLGLEKTFELDWVKIYRLSPTSSVGLVNATHGAHKPSADKPVMVSLVVDEKDVDAWWHYLKDQGIDVGDVPGVGADGHIKAFGFEDPEGYTLEVFAWVESEK